MADRHILEIRSRHTEDGKDYTLAEINGYTVGYTENKETGWWDCQFTRTNTEGYLPQISTTLKFPEGKLLTEKPDKEFTIQTTSYGSLLVENIQEMVEAFNMALEAIQCVKAYFNI